MWAKMEKTFSDDELGLVTSSTLIRSCKPTDYLNASRVLASPWCTISLSRLISGWNLITKPQTFTSSCVCSASSCSDHSAFILIAINDSTLHVYDRTIIKLLRISSCSSLVPALNSLVRTYKKPKQSYTDSFARLVGQIMAVQMDLIVRRYGQSVSSGTSESNLWNIPTSDI